MSPEQSLSAREVGYYATRFAALVVAGMWALGGVVQTGAGVYLNYHGSNNKNFYLPEDPRHTHYVAMQEQGKTWAGGGIVNFGEGVLVGLGGLLVWARLPARRHRVEVSGSATSVRSPLASINT